MKRNKFERNNHQNRWVSACVCVDPETSLSTFFKNESPKSQQPKPCWLNAWSSEGGRNLAGQPDVENRASHTAAGCLYVAWCSYPRYGCCNQQL
jgi:hypothetical protein